MIDRLYSTSGLGVKLHNRQIGRFEVRASATTDFKILEEAYEFFKALDEEASLWDMTDIPELLESKHIY
jgi:hypothetical protein